MATSMKMVHEMHRAAEEKPDQLIYDLGWGDGRIIIAGARSYRSLAVGIAWDP